MIINCPNWKRLQWFEDKSHPDWFKGKCTAGKYDGRPTFGHCIDICKQSKTTRPEMEVYIKTLPVSNPQTPEQIEEQKKKQAERKKIPCYNGCENYRSSCKTGEYCLYLTRLVKLSDWLKKGDKCPMGKF